MKQGKDQRAAGSRRRRSGFSLMEVMVALFVFSLLTLIFAGSLMVSNAATGINGQYAQALSICQHKMDQLRAEGYGKLIYAELYPAEVVDYETGQTSPYYFTQVDGVASILPNGVGTVTVVDSPSDTRVRVVTVTVTWRATSSRVTNSTASLVGYIVNTE